MIHALNANWKHKNSTAKGLSVREQTICNQSGSLWRGKNRRQKNNSEKGEERTINVSKFAETLHINRRPIDVREKCKYISQINKCMFGVVCILRMHRLFHRIAKYRCTLAECEIVPNITCKQPNNRCCEQTYCIREKMCLGYQLAFLCSVQFNSDLYETVNSVFRHYFLLLSVHSVCLVFFVSRVLFAVIIKVWINVSSRRCAKC